jgi:hypothetical protein
MIKKKRGEKKRKKERGVDGKLGAKRKTNELLLSLFLGRDRSL